MHGAVTITRPEWVGKLPDWAQTVYDMLIGFVAYLTNGERALLVANVLLASVGAYPSFLFYEPTRGPWFGAAAAIGIVLLYIGAAGAAVKYRAQAWIAVLLVIVGSVAEMFFGVMISLRADLPAVFDPAAKWPSQRELWGIGLPAVLEGVLPTLAALLTSILLSSMASSRLVETDKRARVAAADFEPYVCPFCRSAGIEVTGRKPAELYGHLSKCANYRTSPLSPDDRTTAIKAAIAAGDRAMRGE